MLEQSKPARVATLILWLCLSVSTGWLPALADNDSDFAEPPRIRKLAAVSSVSWWSHDATGYHPSILIKLENYSGNDLTGQLIRIQGRFVDLTNGIVTIARREVRQGFVPHQQIYVLLKGPQPFELPIDDNRWPVIECKVMCRVGDVGDESTQTLIVTRLESITMNDDDAMQRMSRLTDFSRTATASGHAPRPAPANHKQGKPAKPEKPLVATAGKLPVGSASQAGKKPAAPGSASAAAYISAGRLPGLGDDFYDFEKAFGLPTQTNSADKGWTWASYKHTDPNMTVLAGSKAHTGKVDIIILELPGSDLQKEDELVAVTRALSGSLKSQKLSQPARSVRYLPAGRMQLLTSTASGYHTAYFTASPGASGSYSAYLVLSRVPGNIVDLLEEHAKNAVIIQPVAQLLGGG